MFGSNFNETDITSRTTMHCYSWCIGTIKRILNLFIVFKVNSVQEAYAKCFAVLTNHMKTQNKKHQNGRFIDEKLKIDSILLNYEKYETLKKLPYLISYFFRFQFSQEIILQGNWEKRR